MEKDFDEFELRNNKQHEAVFFEKAVKTAFQILYDKTNSDIYDDAAEVLNIIYLLKLTKDVDLIWIKQLIMSFKDFTHNYILKFKATSVNNPKNSFIFVFE